MKNDAKERNILDFHKKFLDSALDICYNDDTAALRADRKKHLYIDYIKNFQ